RSCRPGHGPSPPAMRVPVRVGPLQVVLIPAPAPTLAPGLRYHGSYGGCSGRPEFRPARAGRGPIMFQTILVPLDGSPRAEHALPLAVGLARAARAAVRLVAVHRPASGSPGEDLAADRAEQAYLDRTADRVRGAGVPTVTTEILEEGSVAPALCAYARAAG